MTFSSSFIITFDELRQERERQRGPVERQRTRELHQKKSNSDNSNNDLSWLFEPD